MRPALGGGGKRPGGAGGAEKEPPHPGRADGGAAHTGLCRLPIHQIRPAGDQRAAVRAALCRRQARHRRPGGRGGPGDGPARGDHQRRAAAGAQPAGGGL